MIILIVEDDSAVAALWMRYLEPVAMEMRVAHDLVAALEEMRRVPHPDLVLLDLRLPGSKPLNTLQHIQEIKAVNPNAVVVVVTGAVEDRLPELAAQLGADAFASKLEHARTQRNLLETVKQAIARRIDSREPVFERSLSVLEKLSALTVGGSE